ncbi:site-specific integrase [Ruminococcus sp.]|uniref:site-specific integrase n=1 Tax=Ruminococcus sp. TaxID=41978 RepID=UPI002600123E|nr:site-specific integrase [Ruminococcus sp.]MBQ8966845.1 site-specific integrase [Ruminococcus sp.]
MANIRKRGKSYQITVSCGYDANGKKIAHMMTWTPDPDMGVRAINKELNIVAAEFEKKFKNGQSLDSKMRLSEYVENYWLKRKEKEVEPTTYIRYKGMLKRILPALGHYRLENIQPGAIYAFYDDLYEEKREDIKYKPTDLCKQICKNDYTRPEFAEKCGIGLTATDSIRAGRNLNEKNAKAVSKALRFPLEDLFIPLEKQLSARTILHHHRVLSDILQNAVYDGLIIVNPCSRVRAPRVQQKEARYLDEEQAMQLLIKVNEKADKPFDVLIPLLLLTGMRRGEACGLEWQDIDFEKNLIHIMRSSLYLPEKGVFESTPKTISSKRVIHIDADLAMLLRYHKRWQEEQAAKLGSEWHNSGRVITTNYGKPINPGTVTAWFYKFVAENDLPDICLHSLRHTCATLLLAAHTPISAVAQRLGHSTSATTSRIYIHAIQSAEAQAAETLHNILPLPSADSLKKEA